MRDTVDELLNMFIAEDILDDRNEYDIMDFISAYPVLTESEAIQLQQMIQEAINGLYT